MIVLLPKPDGGNRPIGLFPSAIRLWMRARVKALRQWERENSRPGLYGSSGMGAAKAAWKSAWHAETTAAANGAYTQAMLDLVKAFESVPHHKLWAHAKTHNDATL